MRRHRRDRQGERGAAMVEFAIVLPLLLVLVFGIIEFGIMLFNQQVITNASREGARFGIVQAIPRRTAAEIATVVGNYCSNHLVTFGSPSAPDTAVTNTGTSFGDDLTVTVTYPYDFLVLPNLVAVLPNIQTLRAETVMKYE